MEKELLDKILTLEEKALLIKLMLDTPLKNTIRKIMLVLLNYPDINNRKISFIEESLTILDNINRQETTRSDKAINPAR